jgi:phosphatidylserine decarboxylase
MANHVDIWILQGRKFSIKGLLGEDVASADFEGGSLAIFRLAPQVLAC